MKYEPAYKALESGQLSPYSTHSSTTMPPKKLFTKDEQAIRGCEFMRAPTDTMTELRSLPASSIILLLTPVVATAPESRQTDPFELFGRDISRRHARVRHVPYIAKVGFTSTHQAFMQQAGAIIIASTDLPPSTAQLLNNDTSDRADSVFEFVVETSSVPVAIVQFGGTTIKFNDESSEIYVKASHASPETFALATCLLFGAEA